MTPMHYYHVLESRNRSAFCATDRQYHRDIGGVGFSSPNYFSSCFQESRGDDSNPVCQFYSSVNNGTEIGLIRDPQNGRLLQVALL